MKGWLIIPVEYKGEQLEFRGKLLKGKGRYGYKIKVKVVGGEVVFEEEVNGKYKVVEQELKEGVDASLIQAIANTIEVAAK
ncbi:hypothetical protein OCK74_14890 [Chitinophagaceae bacterium LB-8]|uniref:Uncharacterized protein n=1 Tax=Paraflavisolibacter caeni TaxID=2982496 RepID=A0A9X2XWX5_9BACT|nr:hypothetical protein [Paraflavisolibacter caeni]MCU7550405.1 hypothetical protein [Paraflavisolibacter caeni]